MYKNINTFVALLRIFFFSSYKGQPPSNGPSIPFYPMPIPPGHQPRVSRKSGWVRHFFGLPPAVSYLLRFPVQCVLHCATRSSIRVPQSARYSFVKCLYSCPLLPQRCFDFVIRSYFVFAPVRSFFIGPKMRPRNFLSRTVSFLSASPDVGYVSHARIGLPVLPKPCV